MNNKKVFTEIFKNRVQAIAEEMASVVLRTGFTAFVKETGDFGTYLISREGETFASPLDSGYNLSIGLPVKEIIAEFQWEEGDVILFNDAYTTYGLATHLPDVYLMKPVFAENQVVAFVLSFIHASDVGGRVPGSVSLASYDIYQEGIRIAPVKLYKKGVLQQDIYKIFLNNCRIPEQNNGDLNALMSGMYRGEERVKELISKYGLADFYEGIESVLSYSEERVRKLIREFPNGKYEFWDYLDPDEDGHPIRIRCTLEIQDGDIFLDFDGTDIQSKKSINMATMNQQGHYMIVPALIRYFRTIDHQIPWNSGMVRMVKNNIPKGSILNCESPAPVASRAATFIRVMDVITGALSTARPNALPAAGCGQAIVVSLSAVDPKSGKRKVGVIEPVLGGSGGRPMRDGVDGMDFAVGHMRNVPVETTEADMPVIVENYGLRKDSFGHGRYRGGAGVYLKFKNLGPDTIVSARNMERNYFQPWGRLGGTAGQGSLFLKNEGTDRQEPLANLDEVRIKPGDTISFYSQGGGGYGDPLARSPEEIKRDYDNDLLSSEEAKIFYGVCIVDGEIDYAQTEKCRAAMRPSTSQFNYGEHRDRFEKLWTDERQLLLTHALYTVPVNFRNFICNVMRARMEEKFAAGETVDEAVIQDLLKEATSSFAV